jgi:hypothetical protein
VSVIPEADRLRSITLRFLAEPTDVNFGGKVHGGAVMEVDRPGGLYLRRRVDRHLLRDRLPQRAPLPGPHPGG